MSTAIAPVIATIMPLMAREMRKSGKKVATVLNTDLDSYHPLPRSEGILTLVCRLQLYIIMGSFGKFPLALCIIVHCRPNFSPSLFYSVKYLPI